MNITVVSTDGLATLLLHIVSNYMFPFYTTCIFWQADSFDHIVDGFMQNMPIPMNNPNGTSNIKAEHTLFHVYKVNQFNNYPKIILNAVNSGCQAYILETDISMDFLDMYCNLSIRFVQRHAHNHFLFIPSANTEATLTNKILNHPFTTDVPDIIVVTPREDDDDVFDLITSQFVGRYNNTAPILLDTYDRSTQTFVGGKQNLYPNKLINMQGRPLKLGLMNYKPYTIWLPTEAGRGNSRLIGSNEDQNMYVDGTEALVFLALCQMYNCTLEVWPVNDDDWGSTFDNGSGTGLLGAILTRKVDVGVSACYLWTSAYQHLDIANIFNRASIAILSPKPHLLSQWQLPILPFSRYLWYAVFASFALTVISLIFTDFFIDLSTVSVIPTNRIHLIDNIFEVSAVLLGQSSSREVTRTTEMVIIGCMLLISMIIDSAYTGGLASFMAIPRYEEPIDTVHQLAAKGWEWGGVSYTWVDSIRLATQPDLVRLLELYRSLTVEQMPARVKTEDFSFLLEKLQNGHFSIPEYINHETIDYLRIMRDDLYFDYTTAFSYKAWPLSRLLNPMLSHIYQAGLPYIWEQQVALQYLDNNLQLRVANSRSTQDEEQGPQALNMSQLLGAFGLLAVGNLFGLVAFFGECIVKRFKG